MRILIIYCGGIPLHGPFTVRGIKEQLQSYLELQLVAEVDTVVIGHMVGADAPFSLSTDIGRTIMEQYAQYEGFVVIHSIDNALYISNLLAFQLANLGKPVIFTGASLPEGLLVVPGQFSEYEQRMYREMSLRTSLITAVQLATQNVAGVLLGYGPRIVQAVKAIEYTQGQPYGFTSLHEGNIATVRFGIDVTETANQRTTTLPKFYDQVAHNVVIIPRMPEWKTTNELAKAQAILLYAYQEQLMQANLELPKGVPIFTYGADIHSKLPDDCYAVPTLTPVAVHAKLMVGAGTFTEPEEIRKFMHTNIAGELGKL